jgi:hypothetical protein
MTIDALKKQLEKLSAQGHGRSKVTIDKSTFGSGLEDEGCVIIDARACDVEAIYVADGDGSIVTDSKGREKTMLCLVMQGNISRMNSELSQPASE